MVCFIVCVRVDFRFVHVFIHIAPCRFFGKENRHSEINGSETGNADARCFNGKYLVYLFSCKEGFKFFSQFTDKGNVDLVIQKTVHFQNVPRLNNTLFNYFFLK